MFHRRRLMARKRDAVLIRQRNPSSFRLKPYSPRVDMPVDPSRGFGIAFTVGHGH